MSDTIKLKIKIAELQLIFYTFVDQLLVLECVALVEHIGNAFISYG
jgi:hypothetical protein